MLSTVKNFCEIKFCRTHDTHRSFGWRQIRFQVLFVNSLTFKTFVIILLAVADLYFELFKNEFEGI